MTDATLSDTTSVQTFNATEGNSTGQQVLATFSDANPSAPLSDYTATVNWGGTLVGPATTSIQLISRTATASTWEVFGTATYSEEGTYTVSVSVSDVDGSHTSTSNTTFSVTDATLSDTTSVQTFNATEGNSTGQQVLATFSDANPSAPLSDYTATVNWGGTLVGPATTSIQLISRTATASTWEVLGTATYSEEGTLYGQRLGQRRRRQPHQHQQHHFSVTDPSVLATGGYIINLIVSNDSGFQTVATFTDPGGPESLSDYSATISWGDLSTSAGVISYNNVNQTFTVQGDHTYSSHGTYPVGVTIHHDLAQDVTASSTAVVTAEVGTVNLFYDNSKFNHNVEGVGPSDDKAIDTTKVAYVPNGATATFANLSGYVDGINGVMVDLSHDVDHGAITASDFTFKVGLNNSPSKWVPAPTPSAVSVRARRWNRRLGSRRADLDGWFYYGRVARSYCAGRRQYRPHRALHVLLRKFDRQLGHRRHGSLGDHQFHRRKRGSQP